MPGHRATTKDEDRAIVRLYVEQEWSIRRIASYLNSCYGTVHNRLKEEGVLRSQNTASSDRDAKGRWKQV